MDPVIGFGMTDEEHPILLGTSPVGRWSRSRRSRAKRQVLLQRLALEFDVGRRYTEREVNEILFVFHPDWSALRRYLVDEGFLDREHRRRSGPVLAQRRAMVETAVRLTRCVRSLP